MNNPATYRAIGLMSGSSLDGLDIAYCTIHIGEQCEFEILEAETIVYPAELMQILQLAVIDNNTLQATDAMFGDFCGAQIMLFLQRHNLPKPDCIASHGHTISHHPELGFSQQIGNAKKIFDHVKLPVVSDFRNADIRAGGQGAPLVPVCDELLFAEYSFCVNIGGIANISFRKNGLRFGFDVCGANQLLNAMARQLGFDFDDEGKIAARGSINTLLLQQLDADVYFTKPYPKSLDNAYVQKHFCNTLHNFSIPLQDKLATATEHIAQQLSSALHTNSETGEKKILITGGGAFNTTLVNRISELTKTKIELPDSKLIQYKEALAMALMGVLRIMGRPNVIPSVTGARMAVCAGEIIE